MTVENEELEPLWGDVPLSLTPVGTRWGIGRVVPKSGPELSPNPRWGIWNLETGKLAYGESGVLAVALSNDEKQIAVWREHLDPDQQPFFGGTRRSDFRWSLERRSWPRHTRELARIERIGDALRGSWPIALEYAADDASVTLTARSENGTNQIFIACDAGGQDRVVDAPPAVLKKAAKKLVATATNAAKKLVAKVKKVATKAGSKLKPAAKKPARKPAAQKPAAKKAAAKKPAKKPARKPARKPAAKKPAARKPAAKKPSAKKKR